MKILTIIVSYNFERWIDRCLGSLRDSKHPTDVVVIDNCSKDDTVGRIRRDWPEVRLIVNDSNLGFGKANNMGIFIAIKEGYDAVFLLNQDAWIDKYTLGVLAEHASYSDKKFGILSPVHCDGSGKNLDFGFAHYTLMESIEALPHSCSLVETPFVNAAFWFIPVSVIQKVGGFSPLFYHYGEDKDFVNRLSYHGYKIGYDPTIFGCHDRAYRETTEFDFFRGVKVYLLSEYANPNYCFIKGFVYSILAGVKKSFQALLTGKLRYSYKFLSVVCWLLSLTLDVWKCRKEYKKCAPVFVQG